MQTNKWGKNICLKTPSTYVHDVQACAPKK